MEHWLFKFNQPRGFDAIRQETLEFTQIASDRRVTAQPGDLIVIFNISAKHLVAIVEVTEPSFERAVDAPDADRWPHAIRTRPVMTSPRGPRRSVPGRNYHRLSEASFDEYEKVIRRNTF